MTDHNVSVMHKKISRLQLKLLDYTEKGPSEEKRNLESNVQAHKLRKEKTPTPYLKKLFLTSVCVVGPFLFPVVVYHTEGYRSLFWPATGFSTVSSVSLLLYLSSRIPVMICGLRNVFYGAHSKVKIVVQDTEYFSNRRRIQCTLLVGVILLILGIGHWADENPGLFNFSLVAIGYIAGLLSVNLYGYFAQSKRLPYYSPRHKKRDGESPAKRELDFSSAALTSSPSLNPMDCFRPSPERDMNCGELVHRGPLPVPPLPPPLKYSPSKHR